MPFQDWSDYMIREISEIRDMGLYPVAAHIERYIKDQPRGKIQDLMDTGILIQCNASFFLNPKTRKKAFRMLSDEMLGLTVKNPYDGVIRFNKKGLPRSSRAGHGIGLSSVQAVVSRYDGSLEINVDDNTFTAGVLMYLPQS